MQYFGSSDDVGGLLVLVVLELLWGWGCDWGDGGWKQLVEWMADQTLAALGPLYPV